VRRVILNLETDTFVRSHPCAIELRKDGAPSMVDDEAVL
jgi:hypothetical protein